MSTLFAHQLPIACKYSILARVYFDVSNTKFGYAKQIVFLYKNSDLYPKTRLLYQNLMQKAPKRTAFCC
ncbi:hypothetical protein EJ73_01762 [Hoylesella shahii DSM 15611 = JCM 12083]|uniref:Uncharacterized protein n=1 Tax=Hoylesella shahii DSM 15611 = JCM 12083 TaxID=1122991 RepID=A0A318I164_9BACT|nr:hypothetical protein EJ73_01762 [Hoylesella shahii DSM 15611 = JCM 12083]